MRPGMTLKEAESEEILRGIWLSVYGAAYVADFGVYCFMNVGFERALELTTAERAETIADAAVEEWLRWNRDGKDWESQK